MPRLPNLRPSVGTLKARITPPPKAADPHYATPEHKAWRLEVLRRAGWRCQHPGCTVHHPARLFADHIVELNDGGAPLEPSNGQALCGAHHTSKTISARQARHGRGGR